MGRRDVAATGSRASFVESLFEEVDRCIADGDLERALERLWPLGDEVPAVLRQEITLVSGQIRSHNRLVIQQMVSPADAEVAKNRLARQLLAVAYEVRRAALDHQAAPPPSLGKTAALPGTEFETASAASDRGEVGATEPLAGSSDHQVVPSDAAAGAEPRAVEVRGLGWKLATRVILEEVDLDVTAGEVVAIVGRNGSGKSSLLNFLSLDRAPSVGTVRHPLAEGRNPRRSAVQDSIAYLRQRPPAFPGSVGRLLSLHTSLRRPPDTAVMAEVDALVERMGLAPHWDDEWSSLSGGFRTRFELVRLLLGEPSLLLLDEPLAALDPPSQARYLDTVRDLARSPRRPAVIITSQHVAEVEAIADMVLVLELGKVRYWGRPDGIHEVVGRRVFDYRGSLDIEALTSALEPVGKFVIRVRGAATRLVCHDDIDADRVLRALLDAGSVQYFSDLSGSALLLLDEASEA